MTPTGDAPQVAITHPTEPAPVGQAPAKITATVVAQPAPGQVNTVEVRVMAWWAQVIVRATRVYLMSILGLLGVDAQHGTLQADDFAHFGPLLLRALNMALAPALVSLLWNINEHFQGWADKFPEMRA